MNAPNRLFIAAPHRAAARPHARRRASDAARLAVRHLVMPGHEIARIEAGEGERIGDILLRAGWAERRRIGARRAWSFRLPTICVVNGAPLLQRHWTRRRLRPGDEVVFVSRPLGGALRGSSGKAVMGIVATIALAAFAPYAAGAIAGAFGAATAPAWLTSAVLLGGSLLIAGLTVPKPGAQNAPDATAGQVQQFYNVQAQGNAARLGQPIPVRYGRLKILPDWAALPWSEYAGKDQYLNVLLSRGEGRYHVHQLLTDDTVIWDETAGLNAAFEDVTFQHCDPGDPVTLFPVNVATAIEVNGQSLPNPNDGNDGWIGGFVVNAAGTETNRIACDFVLPSGLFRVDEDGNMFNQDVAVEIEGRRVDDAGAPLTSYAVLRTKTFEAKKRSPLRFTESVDVTAGRWQIRVRRTDGPHNGPLQYDEIVWQGLRAFILGAGNVFDISVTALRIKATAFTAQSARRFGIVQTRILPVWNAVEEEWQQVATRNPFWAAYDMATNALYGARRPLSKIDFQALVDHAAAAADRGDCFDYDCSAAVALPDALDTALRVSRARHRWSGDVLTFVRDEWREVPRMLLTDREIVRDSVQIKYVLNAEDGADAVIVEYVDENTWQPADIQYPPNSESFTAQRPSRIQIPGICKRDKAQDEAAFYWLSNVYRRRHLRLATERDGRMLGFGDTVRVQTGLPEAWGASGAILFADGLVLTADRAMPWAASGQHYIAFRTRTGRQFGPVQCQSADAEDLALIELDETDLALVEAQAGMALAEALGRADGAEDPSFDFGVGDNRARTCQVVSGTPRGNRVELALIVNDERCYPDDLSAPPALPAGPSLKDAIAPQVTGLYARFGQGVAEPLLSASWTPAPGAFFYVAQVSYDGGINYEHAYEGTDASFAVTVDRAALRLRVQAVGLRRGAWAVVDLEAPEIMVAPGAVGLPSFEPGARDLITAHYLAEIDRLKDRAHQLASLIGKQAEVNWADKQEQRRQLIITNGKLTAEIEEVWTVAVSNEAALASLTTTVTAHTETLDDHGETLDTHDAAIATNATALATQGDAIASLTTTVSAHTTSIGALESDVSGLETDLTALNGVVTDNTADISTNATAITTLDTALGTLTTTVSAHTTAIAGAEGDIDDLESDLSALDGVVADNTADITTNGTAITTLDTALGSLTTTVSAHTTAIDAIEDDVADNAADIVTNADAISTVSGALASLTTTVSAQSTAIANIEDDVDDLGDEIDTVAASVTTEATARADGDTALASSISSLSSTVGGHTATLTTHAASIDGMEAAYTLKLTVDDYVSGFTSVNDGDVADFIFVADNLKAAAPGSVSPKTFLEVGSNAAGATTLVLKADSIKVDSVDVNNVKEGAVIGIATYYAASLDNLDTNSAVGFATIVSKTGKLDINYDSYHEADDSNAGGGGNEYELE
ncbi:MAG: host specificity factor TipJ family phage tail protein [Pseudorhodoplanes sp.]